uniref:Neur_chan_LBD domain-containing protein n=1 Tax=Caenorhabditis tropicalis TaxID=1561998 RepID=A0A1I7UKL4_9PELO
MPRNNLLFQILFLLLCLLSTLDTRRRGGQGGRAFEDSKAEERHFDYKSAPGEAIPDENEEEAPKIILGTKNGESTTVETTTVEATTTMEQKEEGEATTASTEDLIKKLLEGVFDLENLTKIVEEEHAEALDEATNRTVLWIDTSYKAMDYNLSIDEIEECHTWQKYWNLSAEAKEAKALNMSGSLNETEETDDSEKELKEVEELLKQTELVNSKSRLKTLGLSPELLVAYKAVGFVYREICGNHGRTLWYRTREDASLIGVDSFSPICEPFKEQLNPDESTLSQLALKLNMLIQNVTDGFQAPLKRGGANGTDIFEAGNSTMQAVTVVDSTDTVVLMPSSEAPVHHIHHHHHHHHHHEPTTVTQETTVSTTVPSTVPPTIPPTETTVTQDYFDYENREVSSGTPPNEDDDVTTTVSPTTSEIEVYDDDVWDYRDMEKRFKVRHQVVFDGNEIGEDDVDSDSFHMASGRKRRRHVILKTKVRRKRRRKREVSEEEEEKKSGETTVTLHQDSGEDEDDWLNVRQIIKTTDGETTIAIIEERSHLLDGNSTDLRAWIEIDASDLINPTLLISSPEAVSALGLEVDATAFQRFENVGLYLPGICSEYVPKAIDEFNSSSFEGIEIEGPIGVNISALELAGVNLTSLADKLRNDTEVDEILSRTNGSTKNLGGSFILPVLNKNQYDPFSAPIVFQGSAVVVRFGIYIESMSNFQTSTMDYDMDIYLMMSWRDARLVNPYDKPILVKEEDILEKIWRPDPFFANAKEAEFHEVTFLNFLMRIFPDGLVLYETRVKIKPSCNLILCKYPHDKQTCDLLIKSFAYPVETVRFEWFTRRKDAIDKNPDVKLPELYIDRYETTTCANERKSGAFSCLRAVFRLKRDVGFHIAQTYIPTSLALMFSWAIDLWFGFITGFVFFTLLQTLFVIGFDKRANQLKKWAGRKTADITEEIREALLQKATRYHKTGRYLDNFCRVFYPLSFILFLLMYYFVFTEGRQDDCMNRR